MLSSPTDLLRRNTSEVASLPMAYIRLNESVNDPTSSVLDIGRIVSEDPGLSARLLRLVNSSLYALPSSVDTISRAVLVVGTYQLRELALGTSVISMFKGIPDELVSMQSFWRHSVACGVAAKTLAACRREPNVERHFVAGLLHDIGRLLLYDRAADLSREALLKTASDGALLYEAEQSIVGFDHAAMGGALLESWKLPNGLREAVANHHSPGCARAFPAETAIVHLADIIVHVMELGSSGERLVPPLDPAAWDAIDVPTSTLPFVLDQTERQFDEVACALLAGD